ncbi:MAG: hypothetical protein ACQETB_12535 [Halobacteriota archaeon]
MKRSHLLVVCVLLAGVAALVAIPAAADVPDARLVVSDVTVTPAAPEPGNTTTVQFTVSNSAGSATGVAVDRVAIQNRTDGTVHAEASRLGSLSVGDDVTLELSTAFETAGVKDLELVVETEDEDEETVTVTRPVTILVGGVDAAGITDDVQVDARTVLPSELDEDEQLSVDLGSDASGILGGDGEDDDEELRTPFIRVEVTNFGTATARDVVVEPSTENESLARIAVGDIAPGAAESVFFEAGAYDDPTTFGFEATYTLGTDRNASNATLAYRPNRGEVVLTDVDMTFEDGTVTVTGNAANPGLGAVNGAIVSIGETEYVDPAYPTREYFVGTIPESEFVRFDLTADVDHANATTVPVTVTYLADGDPYERTTELEYDARTESNESDGGFGVSLSVVAVAVGSVVVVGGMVLGWRLLRGRD